MNITPTNSLMNTYKQKNNNIITKIKNEQEYFINSQSNAIGLYYKNIDSNNTNKYNINGQWEDDDGKSIVCRHLAFEFLFLKSEQNSSSYRKMINNSNQNLKKNLYDKNFIRKNKQE